MEEITISYEQEEFDELLPLMSNFHGFRRNYNMSEEDDEKWAFLGLYAEAKFKQYINGRALELNIGKGDGGIDFIYNGLSFQILSRIKKNTSHNNWCKYLIYDDDYQTTADYFLFLFVDPFKHKLVYKGCIQTKSDKIKQSSNISDEVSKSDLIMLEFNQQIDITEKKDVEGFYNLESLYPQSLKDARYRQICIQREKYNLTKIPQKEYEDIIRNNLGITLVNELRNTNKWKMEEEERNRINQVKNIIIQNFKLDQFDKYCLTDYAKSMINNRYTLDELGEKYGLSKKNS